LENRLWQKVGVTVWRDPQGKTIGEAMRIFLMLLLSVAGSNAMAQWILVDSNRKAYNYFDTESSHKIGDTIKIEFLSDLISPENVVGSSPFMSIKALYEFKCKLGQSRTVEMYWYSGNMGTGKLIHSEINNKSSRWHEPLAGTSDADYYFVACGKN
jgi:hypothetical protein